MTCLIVRQCQEKPTDESLSPGLAHAAVVVQVLLQVGEHALYLVVRVGHPLASLLLTCEEIGQVEGHAVHGSPKTLVGVVRLACPLACRLAVERVRPVLPPLAELLFKLFPFQRDEPLHELLQGYGGLEPGALCEVAVDD